jgi:hypothetical protein
MRKERGSRTASSGRRIARGMGFAEGPNSITVFANKRSPAASTQVAAARRLDSRLQTVPKFIVEHQIVFAAGVASRRLSGVDSCLIVPVPRVHQKWLERHSAACTGTMASTCGGGVTWQLLDAVSAFRGGRWTLQGQREGAAKENGVFDLTVRQGGIIASVLRSC